MAPTNTDTHEDFDAGERRALEALSQQYREASEGVAPPDALRARIIAAAEESVRAPAAPRKALFRSGWMGLLAVAFSAVLAIALVVDLGVERRHEGVLSQASTDLALPAGAPLPDGVPAGLPSPPVSKGGTCALRVPGDHAPRAAWEAEYRRLADLGCNASMVELQKSFSITTEGAARQKLTGMSQ